MHMSQPLRAKLLPKLQARYGRRDRAGKARLPDELCEDHGYERKHASRLPRAATPNPTRRPNLHSAS